MVLHDATGQGAVLKIKYHDAVPHGAVQCNHGAVGGGHRAKGSDCEFFQKPVHFVLNFEKGSNLFILTVTAVEIENSVLQQAEATQKLGALLSRQRMPHQGVANNLAYVVPS
jgi:hypothetical protein